MKKLTKEIMVLLATQTAPGSRLSWLSGEQLSWLSGEQPIPVVERLYSKLLTAMQNKSRLLDQTTFGPLTNPDVPVCETPMCIAGHTINIAGAPGYALCYRVGFSAAANLIHAASRPGVPAPRYDNYPNEWALAYIEARAAEEAQ